MQATHYLHSAMPLAQDDLFTYKPAHGVDKGPSLSAYLTPPQSALELASPKSNTAEPYGSTTITVSTAFQPKSAVNPHFAGVPEDLVIQTGDFVYFYIHSVVLRARSSSNFAGLLPSTPPQAPTPVASGDPVSTAYLVKTPSLTPDTGSNELTPPASPLSSRTPLLPSRVPDSSSNAGLNIIQIPESSPLLNVVLHILYDASFARFSPDFDTLAQVFPTLLKYGISLDLVPSHSELCNLLLDHAPHRPMEVYALAAQYKLHDLAVLASQFTLGVSMLSVTDEMSNRMGLAYYRKLVCLHQMRHETLRRIAVKPLAIHPEGEGQCSSEDQKALQRAWGLVTAYILSLESPQSVSVGTLNTTYGSMLGSVRCRKCRESLEQQIRSVVQSWMLMPSTI